MDLVTLIKSFIVLFKYLKTVIMCVSVLEDNVCHCLLETDTYLRVFSPDSSVKRLSEIV